MWKERQNKEGKDNCQKKKMIESDIERKTKSTNGRNWSEKEIM